MLQEAIKGSIPLIHVTSSDPMHVQHLLDVMINDGDTVPRFTENKKKNKFYWVSNDNDDYSTDQLNDLYEEADLDGYSIIFVNGDCTDHMMSCGELLPDKETIKVSISEFFNKNQINKAVDVLHGLTFKAIKEVINLTSVFHSSFNVENVRRTKDSLYLNVTGIVPVETKTTFFFPVEKEVMSWVDKNKPYMTLTVDKRLSPKGVLLHGKAGTGKTEFSRYVAREWGIPLFLLDVNAMLTKWMGEAENYLTRALNTLDKESPCVVLFDEVEKLFNDHSENDTSQRLLSKILWWLQYKESKVLVVMTCNDMEVIPPELYRAGRISKVFEMYGVEAKNIKNFVTGLLASFGIENVKIANAITKKAHDSNNKHAVTQADLNQMVIDHLQEINFGI